MADTSQPEINLYYFYAREDKPLLSELEKHLSALKRQYLLNTWNEEEILPGDERELTIDKYINSADLILLLLSPDFMNSDYCYSKKMILALERHRAGICQVIPIYLRPAYYRGAPFDGLQFLPPDMKPITLWQNWDEAFQAVVVEINHTIKSLLTSFKSKEYWLYKAEAHYKLKNYNEAFKAYERATELKKYNPKAFYNKGIPNYQLQGYLRALASYEQAIRLDPTNALAFFNKGNVFVKITSYDEALECFEQAIYLNPANVRAYIKKGAILSILRREEEALEAFERAIYLDPTNVSAFINKGRTLRGIEESLEEDYPFLPDFENPSYNEGIHTLKDSNRYEESLKAFEQAIHLDPTNVDAFEEKIHTLSRMKRYQEALETIEQAITIHFNEPKAYKLKSRILSTVECPEEALEAIEQAIRLDPSNADFYSDKSTILFMLYRPNEAKEAEEIALYIIEGPS